MHVNGLGKLFGLTLAAWGAAKVYETVKADNTEAPQAVANHQPQLQYVPPQKVVPREISDTVKQYLKKQAKWNDEAAFNRGIDDYVDASMPLEERMALWYHMRS